MHGNGVAAGRGNHQPLVVVDAEGCHARLAQGGFHPLQVDAQAVQLDEAAAAADHLVQSVGRTARDVTRPQGIDGFAHCQIRWTVCVAHHDVRTVIDELAHLGVGPILEWIETVLEWIETEGAAGNRQADRVRVGLCEFRWQAGHPGSGFGCAVHDEQLPAPPLAECGETAHAIR